MLKELKLDFPALLAINIFVTFAAVTIGGLFIRIPIDGATGQLLEVLKNIVLLMVGFYFGSSSGSKDANQTVKEIALALPSETKPKE